MNTSIPTFSDLNSVLCNAAISTSTWLPVNGNCGVVSYSHSDTRLDTICKLLNKDYNKKVSMENSLYVLSLLSLYVQENYGMNKDVLDEKVKALIDIILVKEIN